MIYENIKSITEKKNMTIRQLEINAGLSNGTISKWRVSIPSSKSLMKVSKVLGVTMEKIFEK